LKLQSRKRGPKPRVKYPLNGELLPTAALAARTGLSVEAIYSRISRGTPLDKPRGWTQRPDYERVGPALYPHNGEMKTAAQWARQFGVTPQCIRDRARRHLPLDGSHKKPPTGRRYDDAMRWLPSVFDDKLRPNDDRALLEVEAYLARATLRMTDEEIRAQFADLGRLSDAGVDWARELAEAIVFHHNTRGDGESLELIGDLHGFCRERTRQLEERTLRKLRVVLEGRGVVPGILRELRERDATRRATWAEVIDEMAPGSF
jgi:hypothetical protein